MDLLQQVTEGMSLGVFCLGVFWGFSIAVGALLFAISAVTGIGKFIVLMVNELRSWIK